MRELGWGVVATGNVARHFCADLVSTEGNKLVAVTSREQQKAERFAKNFQIPKAFDDYEQMLTLDEIEVVYIATPHTSHYENVLAALRAGKHVVCEKPIALHLEQVEHCVQVAKEQNCFLMEAVWMCFFPTVLQAKAWINADEIGKPNALTSNFDFLAPEDPNHRLYNLKLGGGALMDIGLYPLFFATYLLGEANIEEAICDKNRDGVDVSGSIRCLHANGARSVSRYSFKKDIPCLADIQAEKGSIQLADRFFCGDDISLKTQAGKDFTKTFERNGNGYHYEIIAAREAILAGELEAAGYSHRLMLSNHKLLADIRQQLEIHYD